MLLNFFTDGNITVLGSSRLVLVGICINGFHLLFRLSMSEVSDEGHVCLALSLMLNPSCVKDLDLTENYPGKSAERFLSASLKDPHCEIKDLRYSN